jgi:hypothetical protein
MPIAIRAVVAFNIAASLVVFAVAHTLGGGYSGGNFPPEHEISLYPIDVAVAPAPPAEHQHSPVAIPAEFDRIEPLAPRWLTDRDGRIRLID